MRRFLILILSVLAVWMNACGAKEKATAKNENNKGAGPNIDSQVRNVAGTIWSKSDEKGCVHAVSFLKDSNFAVEMYVCWPAPNVRNVMARYGLYEQLGKSILIHVASTSCPTIHKNNELKMEVSGDVLTTNLESETLHLNYNGESKSSENDETGTLGCFEADGSFKADGKWNSADAP